MSEDEEYLYIPTITQQKIISVLVIVPSLLSFLGSSLVIYHIVHDKRKTPYRRLLLGMAIFDIISTTGWISQPFIMPSNVIQSYVWSFGNQTSCKALAAITQTGIAAHIYSSCLSFYFLLTIRFGMREKTFEKRIEKVMHFVVILFTLGTSATGLITDMFYPMHVGPGCWVSHPPEGDICANDSCGAEKMAWAFGGFPIVICLLSIAINNLILYCHVRSTVKRGQAKALAMEARLSAYKKSHPTSGPAAEEENNDEDDDIQKSSLSERFSSKFGRSSGRSKKDSVLRSSDREWKRVKEVGTQSFLYVGSYFFCFIWTMAKQSLDGQGFDKLEGSGSLFLPLLILGSIFLPIHGFFICVIFFRPKYLLTRRKYGNETRLWCMKRAIFTEKVKPTCPTNSSHTPSQRGKANRLINYAGELMTTEASSEQKSRVMRSSFRMINPLASNISSVASASATDRDQESVQSDAKKRSGKSKQVTYSDDDMWKASTHGISSQIASIEEDDLEISGRDAPPNPGTIDTDTQSQENSVVSTSKRVSHAGEIVEGDTLAP